MESYDFFAKIDTGPLFIITEPSETASEYDLIPICYSSDSYHDDIALVIHNPFTGHWTTLIVPYAYEGGMASRISNSILGGLVMDQDTGTYKVIVAFVDADLPRKTFIYDSSSDSWTTSAAISPVLGRDVDEELVEGEFSGREIGRSIACGRDLFWIVGMSTGDGYLRTLIKYSFELDNWSTFSKLWPDDVNWRPVYLACFENWPYVVNFDSSSDGTRLLTEFLNLVPGLGKFDGDDFERLVNQSETACFPDGLKPYRAIAEGGTWFVESRGEKTGLPVLHTRSSPALQLSARVGAIEDRLSSSFRRSIQVAAAEAEEILFKGILGNSVNEGGRERSSFILTGEQ
ncbi:hypothetical protein R1flu_001352 [Riccia fluitans]|uniref:Uncharacterized protein n=1 Tax=Riccia fluitans TaxID=41844 RepID=A0ABD1Y328_9MARC